MKNILKTIGKLTRKNKKENKPMEIEVRTIDVTKCDNRFKQFLIRVNEGR